MSVENVAKLVRQHREVGHNDNPQFDKAHRCHDWRNYIPDEVRTAWNEMSVEARVMVYILAQQQAENEDWD